MCQHTRVYLCVYAEGIQVHRGVPLPLSTAMPLIAMPLLDRSPHTPPPRPSPAAPCTEDCHCRCCQRLAPRPSPRPAGPRLTLTVRVTVSATGRTWTSSSPSSRSASAAAPSTAQTARPPSSTSSAPTATCGPPRLRDRGLRAACRSSCEGQDSRRARTARLCAGRRWWRMAGPPRGEGAPLCSRVVPGGNSWFRPGGRRAGVGRAGVGRAGAHIRLCRHTRGYRLGMADVPRVPHRRISAPGAGGHGPSPHRGIRGLRGRTRRHSSPAAQGQVPLRAGQRPLAGLVGQPDPRGAGTEEQ